VNLLPSHGLAGSLMLPFVGRCRLCDADLLPARAVGWRWACGPGEMSTPWQVDSSSLLSLPETQGPLATAWQEGEGCLVSLLPELKPRLLWVL